VPIPILIPTAGAYIVLPQFNMYVLPDGLIYCQSSSQNSVSWQLSKAILPPYNGSSNNLSIAGNNPQIHPFGNGSVISIGSIPDEFGCSGLHR
jgi:hypothetical protein